MNKPTWAISSKYIDDDGNIWYYAWDESENSYDWVLNSTSTIIIKWYSRRAAEQVISQLKKENNNLTFIWAVKLS